MTFGSLLVIGLGAKDRNRNTRWVCACECGQTAVVRGANLSSGHTTSCGCSRKTAQAKLWTQTRP